MPRKLRIQYDGALYLVLNRRNYRRDVLESAGAAQSFLEAMEEVGGRYDWRTTFADTMINKKRPDPLGRRALSGRVN